MKSERSDDDDDIIMAKGPQAGDGNIANNMPTILILRQEEREGALPRLKIMKMKMTRMPNH